jgi:hypothetical protein
MQGTGAIVMSQSDKNRADSAKPSVPAAVPDRELSQAELETVSAAGDKQKDPGGDPHKGPGPKYP